MASYVIFWCSGFINPIIYIFSNRNYRNACIKLFTSQCHTDSDQPTLTSQLVARFLSLRFKVQAEVKNKEVAAEDRPLQRPD